MPGVIVEPGAMDHARPDQEGSVAARTPFTGNPKTYGLVAVGGSIALHLYLFVGYWAIKVFFAKEAWPETWVPIALTIGSAAVFARFAFTWIMRLDAQYGRGSGWALQTVAVKLPVENARKRKRPT